MSYSSQTAAFFARLATQPTAARGALYNTMINSLVTTGVWAKLDALYLFAAFDAPTALTNLIQTAYGATASGAPTFTADQGYLGAANKYVDSTFNPTTASSPQFVRDSATVFAWSLSSIAGASAAIVGYVGNSGIEVLPRFSDDKFYATVNSGTDVGTANTDTAGLFAVTRNSSTTIDVYKNGVATSTAAAAVSGAVKNDTITGLRMNGGNPFTGVIGSLGIGSGMSAQNMIDLYNAVHQYLQAVAGVP